MYKHGAYADISNTQNEVMIKALGTIPVYFGTAPIEQLNDFDKVNKPILLESFNDAVELMGYSDNFKKYTLCEAVYAHFKNILNSIAPIVVVNCLDVTKHKATEGKTASLTFINCIAKFEDEDVILSSIKIADKVIDKDYTVTLDTDAKTIVVIDLTDTLSDTSVTYDTVDTSKVTEDDIVNSIKEGLPLVYQTLNLIPTVLASPGFSDKEKVNEQLLESANKINGHWYAWVNSDIPATTEVNTVQKAIAYKVTNGLNDPGQFIGWAMAKNGDRLFHMSTLATVLMQQVDSQNNGVPYESPSNKIVDIDSLCLSDGTVVNFDKLQANELNSKGIFTAIFWGGKWVLWGVNTAAYENGKTNNAKDVFCSSVRMLQYLANEFQNRYGLLVDKPMNRNLVDTILNDFGAFIDSLIARGALLDGKIYFDKKSNADSDIINGNFIFDVSTTTTPPAKSLTLKIAYTSAGSNILFK